MDRLKVRMPDLSALIVIAIRPDGAYELHYPDFISENQAASILLTIVEEAMAKQGMEMPVAAD